ncbi:unnamed protein product [Acanthoscelides obtectus]|uniref:Uncharacterized protein n=1 Tax=Acanthoscelides obtectus TaxID=200917 RepID=A0A9P0NSM8_ACAOB|nr:unnamed protein product [Acanthoscelides obtectus]CAK1641332.1 hypothetical protein AOBTE_LOCUS12340 [Acanthoscelides obtectus]
MHNRKVIEVQLHTKVGCLICDFWQSQFFLTIKAECNHLIVIMDFFQKLTEALCSNFVSH